MSTSLTNPTPAQRDALAKNAAFWLFVKASLVNQAIAAYDPKLRADDWNTFSFIQSSLLDDNLSGEPISQRIAHAIAWDQATPAAVYTLSDFSGIDGGALDAAVLKAWKMVVGL